ncbi:uncharacterized protein LOC131076606 isoform X2 [Cryptomeria japonica]|uniref:uncharacterized protein LOC131076606 isoform X2 n=1 Tax=Cryptomeria japonica TaxID=3369 RepID=UPI0027D9F7CC|nr:uncharacterized protein LOC131076606 isoform X2 [Cryptomeria japonica]
MYGRKAVKLFQELASCEKDHLSRFNSDLTEQVLEECSEHHVQLETRMGYNRAQIIQSLRWKLGAVVPQEIQEKLSYSEKEYFKNYSEILGSHMSDLDLDLTVDMIPPKDPYIRVRVVDDIGEVLLDDQSTSLVRNSVHLMKRTEAEAFVSQGSMEEFIE